MECTEESGVERAGVQRHTGHGETLVEGQANSGLLMVQPFNKPEDQGGVEVSPERQDEGGGETSLDYIGLTPLSEESPHSGVSENSSPQSLMVPNSTIFKGTGTEQTMTQEFQRIVKLEEEVEQLSQRVKHLELVQGVNSTEGVDGVEPVETHRRDRMRLDLTTPLSPLAPPSPTDCEWMFVRDQPSSGHAHECILFSPNVSLCTQAWPEGEGQSTT